jgi:hypothetical protein
LHRVTTLSRASTLKTELLLNKQGHNFISNQLCIVIMKLFVPSTLLLCALFSGSAHGYEATSNIRRRLGKGKGGKGGKGMTIGKGKGGKGVLPFVETASAPSFDCNKACFTVTDLVTSTSYKVNAIKTAQNVTSFYSYHSVDKASFNGPVETFVDESLIMMHKDSTTTDDGNCDVSLVVVHDKAMPDATGCNSYINFTITGDLTNGAALIDDAGERTVYHANNDTTTVSWIYAPCCTDGLAFTYTDLRDGDCITVEPDFVRGIGSWEFVSGGSGSNTRYGLNLTNPIEICRDACVL